MRKPLTLASVCLLVTLAVVQGAQLTGGSPPTPATYRPDQPAWADPNAPQEPGVAPTIPYRRGEHLQDRLPPGADAVTVVSNNPRPFSLPAPAGMDEMEYHTREAAAVAVVRPTKATGELADTSDWIFSTIDADVVEVLKPAAQGQLQPDQKTVRFRAAGGSMRIGSTQVTALDATIEPIRIGATYLIFFFIEPTGTLRASPYRRFELDADQFRTLDVGRPTKLLPGGAPAVLARIRAASTLPPAYKKDGAR